MSLPTRRSDFMSEEHTKKQQSCILFQSRNKSITLIDIPRSLEESQVLPGQFIDRRIRSGTTISAPLPIPEPKDVEARQMALPPAAALRELMTGAVVASALEELKSSYSGPLCLPRVAEEPTVPDVDKVSQETSRSHFIPDKSHYLHGSIEGFREEFMSTASTFNLIVLDPPWPNRSARRKKGGYTTAFSLEATHQLLSRIPVSSHLASDGYVAIWVTNKHNLTEMLTSPNGIFGLWGLEMISEWVWLKVTSTGEPIFDLNSYWRKPWERLLIARRKGSPSKGLEERRVLIAVPDVHSRKPNLRCLFDELLPPDPRCLEVFARNLTAGWWSWGDEILKYQSIDSWVASQSETPASSN